MKLFNNHKANFYSDIVAITASLANVQIDETIVAEEEAKSKEWKAKYGSSAFPVLETPEGFILESAAIARYIARQNPEQKLVGSNNFEAAKVDQWIDYTKSSIIPHVLAIYRNTFGWGPVDMDAYNTAVKDLKSNLSTINQFLQGKKFLVGDNITVADIVFALSLTIPLQVVLDGGFRKGHANLSAFLETVFRLPEVVRRMGRVQFAQKVVKPIAPPKEEKKVEAPKPQPKPKTEDGEEVEKKKENPLDTLPPTKFDLFAFKTFFVNLPDKRGEGMKFFFENYDPEGYIIFFVHYEKYEGEGKVIYQTANLLNGFLQRIDHFRKYCFAMHAMLGEEPNLEIEGVWLFRGRQVPQEMLDHPQFEYYTKRELDVTKEEDRQLITDFWCAKSGDVVNGLPVVECKMHK